MMVGRGSTTVAPSYRRPGPIRTSLVGVVSLAMVISVGFVLVGAAEATAAPGSASSAPAAPAVDSPDVVLVPLRSEPEAQQVDRARARARLAQLFAASQQGARAAQAAQSRAAQAAQVTPEQPTVPQQQQFASPATPGTEVGTRNLTRAQVRQMAKMAKIEEARRRAGAAQAEATRRLQEALEALARALSTSQCHTVGGTNGQTASISCPLDTTGTQDTDDDTDADTLVAASAPETPVVGEALGAGQLDQALAAALADWQTAGGDTSGISATVGDLGGLTLGATSGRQITIDSDAAGWGWGAMDLGTVVRHEVGHALGLGHGDGLMAPSLAPGEARGVDSAPALPGAESETATGDAVEEADGVETSTAPSEAATETSQQQTGPNGGSDEGVTSSAAPTPQPRWDVAEGTATLSIPGGMLRGTLTYTAEGNRLQFASSEGQVAGISLDGITRLAVQGSDGDDAVTVDLRGAPTGMKLDLRGGDGSDSLTVAALPAQSAYSATADGLRLVRDGLTFDVDGFEQVVDQASGILTVTGGGSDLTLRGDGDQVTLSGLLGQLVMLFGAPLVEAILDAGNGSVMVDGNLRWADHGTSLALQGRTVTITAGTSIDTGTGDITLQAHDEASGQSGNASAAVTVTEASLRGGVITISAVAQNTLDGSNSVQGGASAVILVEDSQLSAIGGISLLSSSTAIGRASATADVAQTDASRDAANASVALDSTSVARILGASTVRAGGLLSIRAANLTEAHARADASRASAGGGIARAVVTRTTSAGIHGPVDVAARGLELTASARGTVEANSLGSLAGAIANDLSPYAVTGGLARTTAGYVPAASSLSFARLTGVTEASLSSGTGRLRVVAVDPVRVLAGGDNQVDAEASSLGGRGAAAAIALSDLATRASLSGRIDLDAPGIDVSAENSGSRLRSTASSAGGAGVSVGALAVGVARTVTASTLGAGAVLTGRHGATDATFRSSSSGLASAEAAAGGAAPSLAVLVSDHATDSLADSGSDLVAPHDAAWRARTRDVAISDASHGSSAGNAITLSTVRTRALLAAGPALVGTGSLTLEADQEAEARSRATLVALTFTDHRAIARSDRDVRMGGPVTVSARNRTTSTSVTNPAVDGPGRLSRPRRGPAA